jgi:DNA-binding transcriptional LysR family regulator
MKLQQLRYLTAIVDSGLNISAAAEKLHTSQPGVRQIKLLEDELGFELFLREGRALTRLTQSGSARGRARAAHRARSAGHQGHVAGSCAMSSAARSRSPPPTPRRATCCRR